MDKDFSEERKRLFQVFKMAIDMERDAQELYLEAKTLSDDPFLKDIFEGFYQDEVRHEKELMERYSQIRKQYDSEE